MSEPAERLRVFLCHSSGDKPAVREVCRKLRDDGFDPWLDEQQFLPGQDWSEEIRQALHQFQAVVICLSRGAPHRSALQPLPKSQFPVFAA